MHPAEATRAVRCADCGQEIIVSGGRVYPFGDESALCFECAVSRGGEHDEYHDRWTQPPQVEELLTLEREP